MPNKNIKQLAVLDISSYDDRRALVGILADNGYVVEINERKAKGMTVCLTPPSSYQVIISEVTETVS